MVAIVYQKHRKKSILSWDGRPKAACKITVYRAKAFPWGKVGRQTAARMRTNQEVRKRQHFCRNGVLDSPHQSQQSVAKSRLLRQLLPGEALGSRKRHSNPLIAKLQFAHLQTGRARRIPRPLFLFFEQGPFPALAGKQKHLLVLRFLLQNGQSSLQPFVIEADQGIVQEQGSLRGQFSGHRQP